MDPLAPLISNLHADGRPRIWSLVITVFGDCVQHRGGRLPTARLSRLLKRIGIETGAVRTALSRLSRDGWVEGRREGRISSYTLTAKGRETFGEASLRIYAPPRQAPISTWVFDSPAHSEGIPVPGGSLRPAPVPDPPQGLRLTGHLSGLGATDLHAGLAADHGIALSRMRADLLALDGVSPDPMDAAAARVLLVHRWRRLVLRWPEVPAELTPEDLRPRDVRRAMADAYLRLTPPTEAWLDSSEGEMQPLPAPTTDPATRFRCIQTP